MTEHSDDPTTDERVDADKQAIAEVVEKARLAVVTTVADDGSLVSRPLAILNRSFDGDLYFFTPDPSDKTNQVRVNPAVNVAIESRGNYLSIAGSASVTKDSALIDELWNAGAQAWFEGGKDDPSVALIKVHAESAELQSSDSPRVLAIAKYAKAMITKETPDVGDTTRLDL